ncbi:MAG: hypothetical protein J6033_02290 [Lachnospiraceae bacterium]|nr:hypothetical protein [Lachnospiraceae bacterium]
MTTLLEFRENIKRLYSKYEAVLIPAAKFIFALIVLGTLNSRLGYMAMIDKAALLVAVSALCSFLPMGALLGFAALFSLGHMYALTMEAAALGACLYLIIFILFLRFSAKESIVIMITPLLCAWKIPYAVPIVMGLVGGPASAVSVGCGVIIHYFFDTVITNSATIGSMGDEEAIAKLRLLIDGFLGNKGMIVMVMAFAITVLVVYIIRRLSIEHSWTIAMVSGAIIDMIILFIGDMMYDTNISLVGALLGAIVAILVGKILELFRFCVDYSRTEKVQFEDDEYYYYVKAVPKMTLSEPEKTVKKINSQSRTSETVRRNAANYSGRSVVTERTGYGNGRRANLSDQAGSRSVTINSSVTEDDEDDYEDLF